MTAEGFKRQLEELRVIIGDAIAYFSVWRALMVEDEESAKAMDRYRGLFVPARNALLWMALLQMAKVFDPDTRAVSFRNLVAAAMNDREHLTPYSSPADLDDIERRISDNAAVLERLKRFRDQRIAHYDSTVPEKPSVLYGEVLKLVEEIKSVYNSLRSGYDRSYTAFDNISRDAERHTAQVIQIMREERERVLRNI